MQRAQAILGAISLLFFLLTGCGRSIDEISPADVEAIRNAPEVAADEGDWPWWRGPTLDGKAAPNELPATSWNETTNVIWKSPVPGRGHSSPIVCGDRVFVTTADESAETQSLLCLERATGQQLWATELHDGDFVDTHKKNSHASATPACDGQRVFTVFAIDDAIWVSAVDREGDIVWQTQAGGFKSKHGYGSSPVLYKSLVIVAGDSSSTPFLAGIDRESGDIQWRVRREKEHSFCTPVVAHVAGRDQLVMSGQDNLVSYDPASGEELWRNEESTDSTANTVAWNDKYIFSTGGYDDPHVMAVDAEDGTVVWKNKTKGYVPSPLVIDDKLLVVSDDGRVFCYDADGGGIVWRKRVAGDCSASPILAGGHVYLAEEDGPIHVFRATPDFESVSVNELSGGGFATPAVCGGRVFVRTARHLYCVGEEAAP